MSNIRNSIGGIENEFTGYTGLLGAIIAQAVRDFQKVYGDLIKEKNDNNYNKYKASCLFFERCCNGYCEEEFSKYILEKAMKIEEEKYTKEDIKNTKEYINMKENDRYYYLEQAYNRR